MSAMEADHPRWVLGRTVTAVPTRTERIDSMSHAADNLVHAISVQRLDGPEDPSGARLRVPATDDRGIGRAQGRSSGVVEGLGPDQTVRRPCPSCRPSGAQSTRSMAFWMRLSPCTGASSLQATVIST